MNTKPLLLGLGIVTLAVMPASAATTRTWTDSQGRKLEATFIKLEGETIHIQAANGVVYALPLSKFSAEDQAAAKSLQPHENANALTSVATNATAAAAAAKIDALVAQGIAAGNVKLAEAAKKQAIEDQKAGKQPKPFVPVKENPLMNDEQFVRRVYLDIAGRIPSYTETTDFLKDGAADKRAKLIDTLLASDGYSSHMYNYMAEMLRVVDRFEGANVRGLPYIQWVKDEIKKNTPWNEMAAAMVTADGKVWENGAAGYLLRDSGMPLDNLANTLTIFLGTDVACAQCHDHPFSDWTQRQFYEMAAFFGATSTRYNGRGNGMMMESGSRNLLEEAVQMAESGGADPRRIRNTISNVIGANRYVVSDIDVNKTKLPHDYKYKDGNPGDAVAPKLIMWSEEDKRNPAYAELNKTVKKSRKTVEGGVKDAEDLRQKFSNWMTHPSNPRFAMTIANRMWERAFGLALTPTVKNIDNVDESYNPALLRHLASEMVRVKFNLKEFMRIVYNTKAYQREATTEELAMGMPYYFQGPVLRRMSAEQAWDSFMTLVLGGSGVDGPKNTESDLYGRAVNMDLSNPKLDAKTVLLKVSAVQNMGNVQRGKVKGSLADAGSEMMSDGEGMMAGGAILQYGGMNLMRAAELPQPAPGGHFLRDFGQSERLLIDGGSKEGSVPQVLMMMNGKAQEMLTNPQSLIFRDMEKVKSPADKAETIFLSILNRKPTLREKDIAKRVTAEGENGYADMIWALINSREFCFIQ
ncbi:SLA1 Homology Domain 1 (SHD1) protein [Roseimicrobium gellanilyticum]|uniref:SLA1 Homology Domain 1 (SHD1) protein n=1 Tax=Roseimicrobium gellanilyticum TaxID=748857 RepID=A0A366HTY5_9BACT|nr:DUF1549 domain-containing protein [Roseimicrobium gellanilyticum]RBP47742.1 SLA1 Homology Domain 1 (SHD1) protein [Roseimicrobium gellanilyticum]